ncbi:ATP-dependent Zn protease [Pararhizobium capsulatum DSM 1112]|uniref:ATP-dependent Zn protease n=1 Tax=Pararhizobium capsulatum DSM 1112 TaxID=1121113 RepID=A0ABU0BL83_9HYPH|nr:AAA family ATPase [Pararhizobium capsulatum]MDQ0318994.1 ATP-dependent Zn protease [Pararhizobium capsulatum DSM 1112]
MAEEKPSFERRIADHHIQRHLRSYRRAKACFLVVVLPAGVSSLVWKDAALAWSTNGDKTRWSFKDPVVVATDKALTDLGVARDRIVVLIESDDRDEFLANTTIAAADAVIEITSIDPKLLQLSYREVTGGNLSHADATILAALPAPRRRLVSLSGRPAAAAVARLAAAQENEDAAKSVDTASAKKKTPARPLGDLHGYGDAKQWGLELARDLSDYREGKIQWSDVDNGLLLSGPPGTGKTTFAKALAETCGVGLVKGSYATWLGTGDGHQGDFLKSMREAFDLARKLAPCVLLIDEIDNFTQRGSGSNKRYDDWMRGIVNGLLELLDGATPRDGVVVVGACNDASVIDHALRRPGRLDRHIEIGLPDAGARMHILRQHLGVDLDLRAYLRRTEGLSGADLELVARDARRLARRERTEIEHRHLAEALPVRLRRTLENMRLLARHEIGHAIVGTVLGAGHLVAVDISQEYDPNGGASVAGAAVFRLDPLEHRTATSHADTLCTKFGGMAAERMYYSVHGEGSISDLEEATALATYMIASVAMGDTLSSSGLRDPQALAQARTMEPVLARAVEELLQQQAARARKIVETHRDVIDELVELLIVRGRLSGLKIIETIRAYEAGKTLTEAV